MEENHITQKNHDESATLQTSSSHENDDKSDASKFVELDAAILKDDEYQSLLKSLAPKPFNLDHMSLISDIFSNMANLKLPDLSESIKQFCSEIGSDDDYEYEDLTGYNEEEFESHLSTLAPIQDSDHHVINYDAINEHISNCSNHHNRTKTDTFKDIIEMVYIGLSRGDIRKDQFQKTDPGGAQRIVEIAYMYKIPLRSAIGETIRLRSDTLTFPIAISCFPHFASLLLYKKVGLAKCCEKYCLASEEIPNAMRHFGFCRLIPKCCDPYLLKAYSYAHAAYMVDFGKMINPGDQRSLKEMALSQLKYFPKGGDENLPVDEVFKVGIFRAVGLADASVFKKIVDVCNNVCKVVGEPEIAFETAEKYHIKNDKICFFEDEKMDVDAGEKVKELADSIHDLFTPKDVLGWLVTCWF